MPKLGADNGGNIGRRQKPTVAETSGDGSNSTPQLHHHDPFTSHLIMVSGNNVDNVSAAVDNEQNDCPTGRVRRSTSKAWTHFTKLPSIEVGVVMMQCKYCKRILSGTSKNGTSHLLRHTTNYPKIVNHDIKQFMLSSETSTNGSSSLKNYTFDQEQLRREIALMSVYDERPFTIVEDIGFRRVMAVACPQFKMMGRLTIQRDVMAMYRRERENVRELLAMAPGLICLTSDVWNSITEDHYVCVTGHFIDQNWRLQKKILRFQLIPPPFDGLSIANLIASCIVNWNIEHKAFSITLDNASVNDVVAANLRAHLREKSFLPCDGSFFQIRCCAHILNLVVQAGMKLIDDVVLKLRFGIEYVKQSSMKRKNLKTIAASFNLNCRKKLCTDCLTRWNTTYLMIESAIYYKSAFVHMGRQDPNFTMKLNDDEWEKLIVMLKFLKVFYEVTCLFSETHYPTSNLYFRGIWKVHSHLLDVVKSGENNFMTNMVKDMQEKFSKYWSEYSLILSCAAILDPRYKVKFVEYCYTKIYGSSAEIHVNNVISTLYNLFGEYMRHGTKSSSSGLSIVGTSETNVGDDEFEDYETFQAKWSKTKSEKSQLDSYLEEPSYDLNSKVNVLEYWSVSSMWYPKLAKMARDLLSIPISTVASESAFSTGCRVISPFRSSLKSSTVQGLICLQDWMRAQNRAGSSESTVEDGDSSSSEDVDGDENDD